MKKQLICIFLTLVIIICPLSVFAADTGVESPSSISETQDETTTTEPAEETSELNKKETKVTGIKTELNEAGDTALNMTVKISPSSPERKVKLQRYITSQKKYKTVKKYTTKKANKAKLKITFPKKYRKKTTGKWRIVIDESENAEKYVSKPITVTTRNLKQLNLNARTSCIYCVETGQVLYGKQMNNKRKQASTTKVMTAVLLIESGRLDGNVKISKPVANTPYGNLYMKAGDVYRLKDLLYAMMLPSSNDSAAAIASGVWGTQTEFVKHMNKKASELGLTNTVYGNAHGLDTGTNHSTAYDLARLAAYASQYDDFMKVIGTSEYTFSSIKYHHRKRVISTDKLKSYSKRHLGGKTGFTSGAKYCFVSIYKYKSKHYAVSVMGNSSVSVRWQDMKKLYKYINKYSTKKY